MHKGTRNEPAMAICTSDISVKEIFKAKPEKCLGDSWLSDFKERGGQMVDGS
jgi:hypothetical protein